MYFCNIAFNGWVHHRFFFLRNFCWLLASFPISQYCKIMLWMEMQWNISSKVIQPTYIYCSPTMYTFLYISCSSEAWVSELKNLSRPPSLLLPFLHLPTSHPISLSLSLSLSFCHCFSVSVSLPHSPSH